jgi:hypothetical protein
MSGSNIRYRAWQFFAGWRARLTPQAITEIRELLTRVELALFVAMLGRDQAHCLRVMRVIQRTAVEQGRTPSRELLVAALLHDIGKGRVATWHRVAFVVLDALAPRLERRLERPDGAGWQRALWRLRCHGRLGAERLVEAGVDPRVAHLVAGHSAPPPGDDPELAWLIAADRVS